MLDISTHGLHQLLVQASLFAHNNSDMPLPSINGVLLHFYGNDLVAVATDRFKMAAVRLPLDEIPDGAIPFKMWLPLAQVKLLTGYLKTPKHQHLLRRACIGIEGGDALSVKITNGEQEDVTVIVKPNPNQYPFPDWKQHMRFDGDRTPLSAVTLAPHHLAPFIRVAKMRNCSRIEMGFRSADKAVAIHMDGDFVGLVMPIRPEEPAGKPAWLTKILDGKAA